MRGPGPLRERREALALVTSEVERARRGSGRLVLFKGATGTGRSALLEAAADHASGRGMRVLRARCSPGAAPLAVVRQLLQPGHEFGCVDEPPKSSGTTYDRNGAARLWRLLREHAAEAPLLVAVDDVHLADEPSRRWLVEAARHVDRLPVLLVVTERSQYDIEPPADCLDHTLSPALVRGHTLAPLGANAATDAVRSAVGVTVPEDWADACVRAGAGSPLLLRALLDDLRAEAPDDLPAAVPDTCAALYPGAYPSAVSWWLDSAGQATADVARALAVVDDVPGDADDHAGLAAGMVGADPARVSGWLTAMTLLGLLRPDADGRPRYAHPLLRDAVLSGWSGARRQQAHRTAAEVMLRRGDRAEGVARQLLRTDAIGDAWATSALLDAATVAVSEDRTDDALAYLRRVLDEPMPAARRASVLTELGSLEFATVRSATGIPRLTEAVRLPGMPHDRVRAAVALGTALARRGEARTAIDILRALDEPLRDHPNLIRTVQAASALLSDHDPGIREEVYRWLREIAERTPDLVGAAGQALLVRYEATAGLTSADSAMKRIRALLESPPDPLAEPFLLGTAAAVAQWADELDEAERLIRRGLTGQRASLLHPMHEALLNVRTDIAAARGRYAELIAAPAAPQAGPAQVGRSAPSNAQAHAVIALVETGRTEEAARLTDGFDLRAAPESWELHRFRYARGALRAARGDMEGALEDFLECGRRQTARHVVAPVVTPWRTAAAECRLALGRPDEALALADEELRLARVWNTPRCVGRALRVLGTATGGRRGLELTDRAVRLLRDASVERELLPALVARGRQLNAAGERARARDSLREASELAERLGAVRLRSLAEEALREGGARRVATALTGAEALTGSERRIAALAAGGMTNAEIAELLHLARRTVETHLTSAYRKLGIRRRTELAGALDEGPADAESAEPEQSDTGPAD
ncbi:AAA family ATPase [Streptomyces sp. NPDC058685]|uniref:AAA family ATPase n=1 Tax=Streptomyces sp. NPDC058685 TaxID=3346598 RepID=UPI003664A042